MLAAIVLSYALIIGFGQTVIGGPGRVLLLGYLLGAALRLRGTGPLAHVGWLRWAVWAATGAAIALTVWAQQAASAEVASAIVGFLTFAVAALVIVTIGLSVTRRHVVDTPTVLGVLCAYLLLAQLFASLNQFLAAFNPAGYLHGVSGAPTASDQLYFSVITMATVGFGDITPASEIARAVTVVEALTGQLYLVSVVAAVVGGWRRQGSANG